MFLLIKRPWLCILPFDHRHWHWKRFLIFLWLFIFRVPQTIVCMLVLFLTIALSLYFLANEFEYTFHLVSLSFFFGTYSGWSDGCEFTARFVYVSIWGGFEKKIVNQTIVCTMHQALQHSKSNRLWNSVIEIFYKCL